MELRKDYILDRWVLIAQGRGKRPQEFNEVKSDKKVGICFFCPGNEHLTPPEIGRIGGEKWRLRWFANKFPAVDVDCNPMIQTDNTYFTFSSAYGRHEVVVETRLKSKQLWDFSRSELSELFDVYRQRIKELNDLKNISYVTVFKNHGDKAGTSIKHSHTQILATALIPNNIKEEVKSVQDHDGCDYCRIISIEKNSFRRCFENSSAVAFAPYASRYNYEIWVLPKRHLKTMEDLDKDEFNDMTDILSQVLKKLKSLNLSYNYSIHYSPLDTNLHYHMEITPRIATWAGFEISSGIIINTISPEEAAKFYRGESDF